MTSFNRHIRIPDDFLVDMLDDSTASKLSNDFLIDWLEGASTENLNNAFVIQRALTAFSRSSSCRFIWSDKAIDLLKKTPSSAVLLSCIICLDGVTHCKSDEKAFSASTVQTLKNNIDSSDLKPDWFGATSGVVCADYISKGWHHSLYASQGELKSRDAIEDLLHPIITARIEGLSDTDLIKKWKDSLVSVVYELFENTHIHSRFDYDGKIKKNIIRTLIIRGTKEFTGGNSLKITPRQVRDCLEITVLDSGVGFFGSAFKRQPNYEDLDVEWLNVRKSLEKHVSDGDYSPSHRGIGLYEVLRALHFLKGAIQIRSGNTFGYRSFFPGDPQLQMEPKDSKTRPNMPKTKFLDYIDFYRPTPTRNSFVIGVVARTIVPLVWS